MGASSDNGDTPTFVNVSMNINVYVKKEMIIKIKNKD